MRHNWLLFNSEANWSFLTVVYRTKVFVHPLLLSFTHPLPSPHPPPQGEMGSLSPANRLPLLLRQRGADAGGRIDFHLFPG